jgi:hypothetical protein
MKRRLYFVLPDQRSAKAIERELLLARIQPSRIGFLAKSDTSLCDLPRAGPVQSSDLRHGIKVGLLSGGLTGAAVGLLLLLYAGLQTGPGLVLGMTLLGAVFGSWAASLVAVSVPNRQLKRFEKDVIDGQILLMIDVPKEKVQEVTQLITERHPEADARGIDPTIPAFP